MFRSLFAVLLLTLGASAQNPAVEPQPTPVPTEVPTFANATCPIMGKKVSMPLFVDTELGRFYLCCKPCSKKVLADVKAAHKTAYPVVQALTNPVCPVSGEPIGADAVSITLQGYTFRVCCERCLEDARRNSQVTLAKVTNDKLVDVGNTLCPVAGTAVTSNAFVVIGTSMVRLSSTQAVAAAAKDPAATLAKAQAITRQQPEKPKHAHGKAPTPSPGRDPAPTPGRENGK